MQIGLVFEQSSVENQWRGSWEGVGSNEIGWVNRELLCPVNVTVQQITFKFPRVSVLAVWVNEMIGTSSLRWESPQWRFSTVEINQDGMFKNLEERKNVFRLRVAALLDISVSHLRVKSWSASVSF